MRTIKVTAVSILAIGLLASSAVGVAAQDEEAAAEVTSFKGVFSPDGQELPGEGANEILPNGFGIAKPGFAWQNSMHSSEPRLTGEHWVIANWVIDPNGFEPWSRGEEANMLLSTSHGLTNDGGSWLGEGKGVGSTDLDVAMETIVFVGQGGYEGLTAFVIIDSTRSPATFSGVIFPAAVPEVPDPYVAE